MSRLDDRDRRMIEAAVALLEAVPGQRMQITNLNKALFYLDLVALRDLGHTITQETYVALKQGPVMDRYKERLISTLRDLELARQDDEGLEKPVVLTRTLESFHYMDDYLRSAAAKVGQFVAQQRATDISAFSHKNPGWAVAFDGGLKSGNAAQKINMRVAMQQLADRDPWLNAGADEEFMGAIDSDAGQGVPW